MFPPSLLSCRSQLFNRCVIVPVPQPSEVSRLIALQSQSFENRDGDEVLPRTVHDAFWQVYSDKQEYLVMYSYGADHCGITLFTEYTLCGRIRQAFRRQEADCYPKVIEDAFKQRSLAQMPEFNQNHEATTIVHSSLIKLAQIIIYIYCRLSQNTNDELLQNSMDREVFTATRHYDHVIHLNAWRFCVSIALFPLYRVPIFVQTCQEEGSNVWDAVPTPALREDRERWKHLRDFFKEVLLVFEDHLPAARIRHLICLRTIQKIVEIASILFLASRLFERLPSFEHASVQRKSNSSLKTLQNLREPRSFADRKETLCKSPANTVEEFLRDEHSGMLVQLLHEILDFLHVDDLMKDQEVHTYLLEFCPKFCRESRFLSALKSITVSQAHLDTSFRKLKLQMRPPMHVTLDACTLYQSKIQQLMSDNEDVLMTNVFSEFFSYVEFDADMKLCALLLGYTEVDCNFEAPQFWILDGCMKENKNRKHNSIPVLFASQKLLLPWQLCKLPLPNTTGGRYFDFPFLFQAPVKFVCQRICSICDLTEKLVGTSRTLLDFLTKYQQSFQQLLSMAFSQKMTLMSDPELATVGAQLFQDAVEAVLNLENKHTTKM